MRKKSVRKAAADFCNKAEEIKSFCSDTAAGQSKKHISWIYDYAVIRLYREFESLMFDALVGAINNDTSTLSEKTGCDFPDHLKEEVCRFLVTGSGYFDFRGRSGLIRTLKNYVSNDHYLVKIIKKRKYLMPLKRLTSLRNHAAHRSAKSKRAALNAIGQKRMGTSGSWLKSQGRFTSLADRLQKLAREIEDEAPY